MWHALLAGNPFADQEFFDKKLRARADVSSQHEATVSDNWADSCEEL